MEKLSWVIKDTEQATFTMIQNHLEKLNCSILQTFCIKGLYSFGVGWFMPWCQEVLDCWVSTVAPYVNMTGALHYVDFTVKKKK